MLAQVALAKSQRKERCPDQKDKDVYTFAGEAEALEGDGGGGGAGGGLDVFCRFCGYQQQELVCVRAQRR